jgi:hypothetical protein
MFHDDEPRYRLPSGQVVVRKKLIDPVGLDKRR